MNSVANKVQPEEVLAARVLNHVLVVHIAHTDVNGEADLAFVAPGGLPAAVEVTFLTDQQIKVAQDAWVREREREYVVTQLRSSWNVTVEGDSVKYKLLRQHLEPHLASLEAAGIADYDRWSIGHRLLDTMPEVVRALASLRVVQATVIKTKDPSIQHIFISPMGGYTARGSDAALDEIEEYLAGRTDNLRKLESAAAAERHLFVWLDRDTPGSVARPFTGGRIVEEFDHFGLPSRPPELPGPVTDLWVMHVGTGMGWRWGGGLGWEPLDLQAQFAQWNASGDPS
jgi:hypothetical protein